SSGIFLSVVFRKTAEKTGVQSAHFSLGPCEHLLTCTGLLGSGRVLLAELPERFHLAHTLIIYSSTIVDPQTMNPMSPGSVPVAASPVRLPRPSLFSALPTIASPAKNLSKI